MAAQLRICVVPSVSLWERAPAAGARRLLRHGFSSPRATRAFPRRAWNTATGAFLRRPELTQLFSFLQYLERVLVENRGGALGFGGLGTGSERAWANPWVSDERRFLLLLLLLLLLWWWRMLDILMS